MKRIALALIAAAVAFPAAAQLYKYVDKNGKTVYSDQPPANVDSKQLNLQSGATSGSAPAKSAVERDKELEKGRAALREQGKKGEEDGKVAAVKAENCARARQNFALYSDGGRVTKINDKGERVMLGDEELAVEMRRAQRDVDEYCKS